MPHFVRVFFIAFASVAASCSSEREQKEAVERKEMGQQLTAAYYSCVRTSFASQQPTNENALSENPNLSNAAIATHRNALKEELLRR